MMLKIVLAAAVVLYFVGRKHACWWIVWPGTVVHEVMHTLMGIVLQANPSNFSVMPQKSIPGVPRVIGSVSFNNMHWFNTAPIALAPLFIIPVVVMYAQHLHFSQTWQSMTIAFLLANVLSQSIPSPTDIQILKSRPGGVVFWITVVFVAAFHYVPALHNLHI